MSIKQHLEFTLERNYYFRNKNSNHRPTIYDKELDIFIQSNINLENIEDDQIDIMSSERIIIDYKGDKHSVSIKRSPKFIYNLYKKIGYDFKLLETYFNFMTYRYLEIYRYYGNTSLIKDRFFIWLYYNTYGNYNKAITTYEYQNEDVFIPWKLYSDDSQDLSVEELLRESIIDFFFLHVYEDCKVNQSNLLFNGAIWAINERNKFKKEFLNSNDIYKK